MLNTGRIFCLVLLIAGCCALPANTNAQTKQDSSNNNNRTTELFAYPAEQSAIESKQNARNRTPIFIPKQCAENEILYPGDHENDWVCDCKPSKSYVYHPETQQCYQMYTRGYCPSGKIIYIEPKGKHPECVPNQCADGKVRFMNVCAVLNQEHQLCHLANIKLVVGIDEDTHELECVNISDVPFNRTLLSSQRESAGV
uniref:DUF4789 domain-containing protein n=1 Tax=Anopheles coluzzii TaxID=1518534 RepID=A0A8W7Q4K4_ANOCL